MSPSNGHDTNDEMNINNLLGYKLSTFRNSQKGLSMRVYIHI